MKITFEQITTQEITVDIQDGFYVTNGVSSSVYKMQGENVLFVSYYENANDGLFLNSKIEIIQAYLFASSHYQNCMKTTKQHFESIFNKVLEQIGDLTL